MKEPKRGTDPAGDFAEIWEFERRNSIELHAINGSGRKRNCSYADSNTGQIRVEGTSVDTQCWKHRGGAGSRANLMVTVR